SAGVGKGESETRPQPAQRTKVQRRLTKRRLVSAPHSAHALTAVDSSTSAPDRIAASVDATLPERQPAAGHRGPARWAGTSKTMASSSSAATGSAARKVASQSGRTRGATASRWRTIQRAGARARTVSRASGRGSPFAASITETNERGGYGV